MARSSLPSTSSLATTCCGIVDRLDGFALPRIHSLQKLIPFVALQRVGHDALLFRRHLEKRFHALVRWHVEEFLDLLSGIDALLLAAGAFVVSHLVGLAGVGVGGFLFAFFFVLIALELCLIDGALEGVGRKRLFSVGDGFDHLLGRKVLNNLTRVHMQCAKLRKASIERAVVYLVRMKLLVDPLVQANGHNVINVAGSRTEGQAVQRVHDLLLLVHLRAEACFSFFLPRASCAQTVNPSNDSRK